MHGRGVRPGARCEYGQASLPVATLPLDFDGVPLDGEQYLAMVRYVRYLTQTRSESATPDPVQCTTCGAS